MDFKKINLGEMLSLKMNLEVVGIDKATNSIKVKDLNGNVGTFDITGDFSSSCESNVQFSKEKKVSRTELAELLAKAKDDIFTVTFIKEDGAERILTGVLLQSNNIFGRSEVIDLEIDKASNRKRQVDHRDITELILRGTKYILK